MLRIFARLWLKLGSVLVLVIAVHHLTISITVQNLTNLNTFHTVVPFRDVVSVSTSWPGDAPSRLGKNDNVSVSPISQFCHKLFPVTRCLGYVWRGIRSFARLIS